MRLSVLPDEAVLRNPDWVAPVPLVLPVLRPLRWFGLVECRGEDAAGRGGARPPNVAQDPAVRPVRAVRPRSGKPRCTDAARAVPPRGGDHVVDVPAWAGRDATPPGGGLAARSVGDAAQELARWSTRLEFIAASRLPTATGEAKTPTPHPGDTTRAIRKLLGERSRREIEDLIVAAPDAAPVIRGTGGIRKLRWTGSGRGKRGSIRTVYFFHAGGDGI